MFFDLSALEFALLIEILAIGLGLLVLIIYVICDRILEKSYYFSKIKEPDFDLFFKSLTKNQQREFVWWFVYQPCKKTHPNHDLFINCKTSQSFFKDFVKCVSEYQTRLSAQLIFKMLEFAKYNYYDEDSYGYVEDRQLKLFYSLKDNPTARKICKDLCYEKIQNSQDLKTLVPYYKHLISLESEDDIGKAVVLCNKALQLNLSEKDKKTFENKLKQLNKKSS